MMISSKKIILASLIATLTLFAVPIRSAQAETVPYDSKLIARRASTNDEVGIAFLKTAGNLPDFKKVVEKSPAYLKLDPLGQKDYFPKTVNKLHAAYLAFTPKKSDLIIRLKVNANFKRIENGNAILDITTPDPKTEQLYFPFYFADFPIALIIKDFEMFEKITLNKDEADIVYSRLALNGAATLLLDVYPIGADDQQTMMLGDIAQYPLLAEIGYIGLVNKRAEQIWAWKNAKYDRQKLNAGDNRAIIDLVPDSKNR